MLKILSNAEGDNSSQPPTPQKVSVFGIIEFGFGGILLGLVVFIVALFALNYFNILSLSKMNPKLFSLLPTSRPIPGSCKVVEEKFCPKGEHAEWTDSRGAWTIIVMNLEKDTPIYSPSKGQNSKVQYDQPAAFRGASANISNPKDSSQGTFVLMGDIKLNNPTVTSEVEPGTQIGIIGDMGEKNFGYNFAVVVKKDSKAHERLKAFFSDALKQSPKEVEP